MPNTIYDLKSGARLSASAEPAKAPAKRKKVLTASVALARELAEERVAMQKPEVALNPAKIGAETETLVAKIKGAVIGQDEAVEKLTQAIIRHKAGLSTPGKPVGVFLLVGPTGVGKTHIVQSIAETCSGERDALFRIDAGEYKHSHEVAKLIGSPPGYLGHRETTPLLTNQKLEKKRTADCPVNFILFDEVDKAHPSLLDVLLGIMDNASLRLGDNTTVNFDNSLILLTANTGSAETQKLITQPFGLRPKEAPQASDVAHASLEAVRKSLTPEFFNRLDGVISFNPLDADVMDRILALEISRLQERLAGQTTILVTVDPAVHPMLMADGFDPRYGVRHLKRSIRKNLELPLANLIVSGQLASRAHCRVRLSENGELEFVEI